MSPRTWTLSCCSHDPRSDHGLVSSKREPHFPQVIGARLTTFLLISRSPKVWACRPEQSSYSARADKELPASAAYSSPRATSGET